MKIEELIPGMTFTFLVSVNGKLLTFESKITDVHPLRHLVLAQAVYRNDKIVSFHGKNIIVDLVVNTGEEKPHLFKDVTVHTMKKSNGTFCYNLVTDVDSKPYNRRESYRCYVDLPSELRMGMDRVPLPVTIRDVSINGFSFICDRDYGLKLDHVIHLNLLDELEETGEKFDFQMFGLVSRIQRLKNEKILYGCRLNNSIPGIEPYIMKKERLRLRKTNGGRL